MAEERKLVAILFADVTGSTALGEALDPEDVRALMGQYYNHARSIMPRYGGTLEKFIGDAVMAVFGLPRALGDDAERALAAAIALRAAVANDEILGPLFQLRIGVNVGEVVATSDPTSGQFLATGDAMNTAARLQQNANPGDIIASERTVHATQHAFLFAEARIIEVKGKREPLHVYPLIGPRPTRTIERPPLVGRKSDLLQLQLLASRALEEQRPQLISIVAPAGTGKTRLLEEFLKRLDPDDGFQTAIVRCLPYGQTLTYWPLRGFLTSLLGAEISASNVATIFTQANYKTEDAARLANVILTTWGIESEVAQDVKDRESIFQAWRVLIEALSLQSPRVLVFEDLHWASNSLLDLVEYIVHPRTQAALMIIVLSRPELLDRRPTWGSGRQNFTSLVLQPLTTAQTRDLITRLLKDIPQTTRERIVEKSGGNPFFALELIRNLAERGLTGSSATSEQLPDTVHSAVLARLDLLPKAGRAVLQVAAVAGRTFSKTLLAEVLSQFSFTDIEAALDDLLARDMIAPSDSNSYTFRHILIRDVAYGTLSRSERIRLHDKIATTLETTCADRLDEYTEIIAYHYRETISLSRQSAVRSSLPIDSDRALRFLQRAGILASHAGAFAEAQLSLQAAIDIAPEKQRLALYELLGDSLGWSAAAVTAYQKALEYWSKNSAGESEDKDHMLVGARLHRKFLIQLTRFGANKSIDLYGQQLIDYYLQARQLAEAAEDEYESWRVRVLDLFFHEKEKLLDIIDGRAVATTDPAAKIKLGEEAAAYFERIGDRAACSEALDGCQHVATAMDALEQAHTFALHRLDLPNLPAHEYGDMLDVISRVYWYMDDPDQSIGVVKEALAKLRPGQPIIHLAAAIGQAIQSAFYAGRWAVVEELRPRLEEAYEQSLYSPQDVIAGSSGFFTLFSIAIAREDQPSIEQMSSIIERLISSIPRLVPLIRELLDMEIADDPGKLSLSAAQLIEQSFGVISFLNVRGLISSPDLIAEAEKMFFARRVVRLTIDIAQALVSDDNDTLAQLIEELERRYRIVEAARMRIVLAQRTGERSHLDRARPVLEQLQDRRFLRRLEEVEVSLSSH
jgi:class 3 adenylate cyclase